MMIPSRELWHHIEPFSLMQCAQHVLFRARYIECNRFHFNIVYDNRLFVYNYIAD